MAISPARRLVPVRLDRSGTAALPAPRPAAVPVRVAGPTATPAARRNPLHFGLGQQVLVSLMLVATVAGMVGSGTFASFNAVTKNAVSITSGTLLLGDKVNAGSECFSAGGAAPSNPQTIGSANSSACTGVWSITTQTPGTAISPLQVTIRNVGNVNATSLVLFAAGACANSTNGTGYHGGGSLCPQVQLEVQQYSDSSFATPSHCWYGSGTATTCTAEANKLPAGCNVSTCTSYSFSDASHNLSNFGSTVTSGSPINTGSSTAGGKAYFLVFANLPGNSGDSFQGERADLTFTWELVQ